MKLSKVNSNEKCRVIKNLNLLSVKKRLDNLGLTENSIIMVVRKFPRNGPIELKVRDFYLAIRYETSNNILVEKL